MPKSPITVETTVGEIVRAIPNRARLFENLGIDYCCGGKKSLTEACRAKGLDPATVATMLDSWPEDVGATSAADLNGLSLAQLCDHIERVHHDFLRDELPRLDFMTRKVAAVHGDHEPRLREVRAVFESFAVAISAHTVDEEQNVFPAIRQFEAAPEPAQRTVVQSALTKLEAEHDEAGHALERWRQLTDNFTPPEWACNTFRALYDGLARLESETHQHVHKENNILFPRTRALAGV